MLICFNVISYIFEEGIAKEKWYKFKVMYKQVILGFYYNQCRKVSHDLKTVIS